MRQHLREHQTTLPFQTLRPLPTNETTQNSRDRPFRPATPVPPRTRRRYWPGASRMLRLRTRETARRAKIGSPSGGSSIDRTRRKDCAKPFTQRIQLRIQGEQLRMPLVAQVTFGGMLATLESTFTEGPDRSEIRTVFSDTRVHYVDPPRHCPMSLIRSPRRHISRPRIRCTPCFRNAILARRYSRLRCLSPENPGCSRWHAACSQRFPSGPRQVEPAFCWEGPDDCTNQVASGSVLLCRDDAR